VVIIREGVRLVLVIFSSRVQTKVARDNVQRLREKLEVRVGPTVVTYETICRK